MAIPRIRSLILLLALFELTVDVSPPGDRSEPFVVQVSQAGAGAGGTGQERSDGVIVPTGGLGGGCGLAVPGTSAMRLLPDLLLLLAPFGLLGARTRRRQD